MSLPVLWEYRVCFGGRRLRADLVLANVETKPVFLLISTTVSLFFLYRHTKVMTPLAGQAAPWGVKLDVVCLGPDTG